MSYASDGMVVPPYLSYEELQSAQRVITLSDAGIRLFWSLSGPFPDAISVMEEMFQPSSATPYFANGALHSISKEPISIPKISSIAVQVYELDHWEDWWAQHHRHRNRPSQPESLSETYSDDDESSLDEEEEQYLTECCGELRPVGKAVKVVVKPESGDFVTVNDYVSAVHPWLMTLKEDIKIANGEVSGEYSFSEPMVNALGLKTLHVMEKSKLVEHVCTFWSWVRPSSQKNQPIGVLFGPDPQPVTSQPQPVPQDLPLMGSNPHP